MITMAMIGRVRRVYFREKKSVREIVRLTSLSRNTVRKWPKAAVLDEPKYLRGEAPGKLTAHHETLKLSPRADAHRPRHGRRTAPARYERIRRDGYAGCYSGQRVLRPGRARPPAEMMHPLVDEQRDTHAVEPICEVVLQVAPSAYRRHAERRKDLSLLSCRAQRDGESMPMIEQVWKSNLQVCGADKVWKQMNREGVAVARCTVEFLMRRLGLRLALRGAKRGKVVRTTVSDNKAPCPLDKVNRQFRSERPNQLWVSDFTCVSTWQGGPPRPRQTSRGISPIRPPRRQPALTQRASAKPGAVHHALFWKPTGALRAPQREGAKFPKLKKPVRSSGPRATPAGAVNCR
ncbi:MAG: IS3 family transposase [Microbacteriaceae bacterium]|nr:IS3 family transposase [Burkholderiaceae bacterium]